MHLIDSDNLMWRHVLSGFVSSDPHYPDRQADICSTNRQQAGADQDVCFDWGVPRTTRILIEVTGKKAKMVWVSPYAYVQPYNRGNIC